MLTVRPDDYIVVGKTARDSYIAYHQCSDDRRELDDCDSFLLPTRTAWHLDELDASVMAARRLIAKLGVYHSYSIERTGWWWAEGWRIFPLTPKTRN